MFRSVYNPICLGLGTAAIFAMGAPTAAWAATTPSPSTQTSASPTTSPTTSPTRSASPTPDGSTGSPSPSATASPGPWGMEVEIGLPEGKIFEGDEVTVTVEVSAEQATPGTRLTLAAEGRPAPTLSKCVETPCRLGKVDWRGKKIEVKLTLPKDVDSGRMRLIAAVSGQGAENASHEKTFEVLKKLEPSPSPSPSRSSGGSGSSGGSSGSGGSAGGTAYTPPTPNGGFSGAPTPQVDLPQVSPPSPELAPGAHAFPPSALRSNDSPVAQDMTFERLASTQAAWLSALLVAFSLLLIQLRLGRRAAAAGGAAPRRRAKGAHRRPRRGKPAA